jgi:putative transposase
MRLTFKYRLMPTKAQVEFLTGEFRDACSLYNAAVQERRDAWKTCHKSINYYDQANQLKAMRADGCLTLANFSCSRTCCAGSTKPSPLFFARCKQGDKPGFPRYRSARRYDSITFPSYGDGCRLLPNGNLRIQGAGHIKVNLHRPVEGTVKTVTVKREAGRWFVCFQRGTRSAAAYGQQMRFQTQFGAARRLLGILWACRKRRTVLRDRPKLVRDGLR